MSRLKWLVLIDGGHAECLPRAAGFYIKGQRGPHRGNTYTFLKLWRLNGETKEWPIRVISIWQAELSVLQPLQPRIPSMQRSLLPAPLSEAPPPLIRSTNLCRSIDLILSKGLAAAPTSLWPTSPWWREAPWDLVKAKKMPVTVSMNAHLFGKVFTFVKQKVFQVAD